MTDINNDIVFASHKMVRSIRITVQIVRRSNTADIVIERGCKETKYIIPFAYLNKAALHRDKWRILDVIISGRVVIDCETRKRSLTCLLQHYVLEGTVSPKYSATKVLANLTILYNSNIHFNGGLSAQEYFLINTHIWNLYAAKTSSSWSLEGITCYQRQLPPSYAKLRQKLGSVKDKKALYFYLCNLIQSNKHFYRNDLYFFVLKVNKGVVRDICSIIRSKFYRIQPFFSYNMKEETLTMKVRITSAFKNEIKGINRLLSLEYGQKFHQVDDLLLATMRENYLLDNYILEHFEAKIASLIEFSIKKLEHSSIAGESYLNIIYSVFVRAIYSALKKNDVFNVAIDYILYNWTLDLFKLQNLRKDVFLLGDIGRYLDTRFRISKPHLTSLVLAANNCLVIDEYVDILVKDFIDNVICCDKLNYKIFLRDSLYSYNGNISYNNIILFHQLKCLLDKIAHYLLLDEEVKIQLVLSLTGSTKKNA